MIGLNTIVQGNCLELLPMVASVSVDMVITSPPYDNLRTYKGYSFDFEGIARELYRIVKVGGVVVWVVGDATVNGSETGTSFRQALYFKEIGFNLHDTMLYHKINYIPLTHRRYEQAWEYMFCFSKGSLTTFNGIRVEAKCVLGGSSGWYEKDGSTRARHKLARPCFDSGNKLASNIFSYPIGNEKVGHPAVFPLALAVDQISSWTNPNDVVLDPFAGSGTTGIACHSLNRNFIQFELSPEYCRIAQARLIAKGFPVKIYTRKPKQ